MATKRTRSAVAKTATRVRGDTDSETIDPGPEAGGKSSAELIRRARESLMQAVPGSAAALAEAAAGGSVQHIKLLLHLVGLDEGGLAPAVERPKEKALQQIVMEEWSEEP